MPACPVTILGGLPVIADVWFSGPDYYGEYDCGVDALYWRRKDGKKGKALSTAVMDRVERIDYWEADVTEQASEWLSLVCPTKYPDGTVVGEYDPEYLTLNPGVT